MTSVVGSHLVNWFTRDEARPAAAPTVSRTAGEAGEDWAELVGWKLNLNLGRLGGESSEGRLGREGGEGRRGMGILRTCLSCLALSSWASLILAPEPRDTVSLEIQLYTNLP